jgi:signal transduction histidine kinase
MKRLALTMALLLIPALVLCIIQYRWLTELESKTRVAMTEQLRQDLVVARKQVQSGLDDLARAALVPVSERFFTGEYSPWVEDHFAESRRSHPEIQQLFLVSYSSVRQGVTVAYLDGPAGQIRLDRNTWKRNRDAVLAVSAYAKAQVLLTTSGRSQMSSTTPSRSRGFLYWQQDCPNCADKPEAAAYIFYCLLDPQTNSDVGFVGMRLSLEATGEHYLPQTIGDFQKSALARGESTLGLAVFDASQHKIYATLPSLSTYESRIPLTPGFPRWDLAAGYAGTTVAGLARASLLKNLGLFVLAFSILLLGMSLIVRAANREMRLAEAKATFVSNVSHELKTPLSLIRLFAETLQLGRVADADKAHEYYRIIHNESVRLSHLIDNILDFAKIESGRKEYNFKPVDLKDLVASVVETYRPQIIREGFELTTRFEEGLPTVAADREAISQAVLNLLDNALKYATDIKRIAVSVRQEQRSILIQVTDQGIGIAKSEQGKIFETFYRVGSNLVHNTKGSGLGLSLVKHIVEAHDGEVRVDSAPGKGSTFTILMPICHREAVMEKDKDIQYDLAENPNR